jgi:fatty acid desaturase
LRRDLPFTSPELASLAGVLCLLARLLLAAALLLLAGLRLTWVLALLARFLVWIAHPGFSLVENKQSTNPLPAHWLRATAVPGRF